MAVILSVMTAMLSRGCWRKDGDMAVILSVMCLSWDEINCFISLILVSFDDLNFYFPAELQRCLGIYVLLHHSRQARYHFAISYHGHCNHAYIYFSMLFIISVGISS